MKNKILFPLFVGVLALSACAPTHTAIEKRALSVETRMSDTIFLDPVSPESRTVFMQLRNSSGESDFNIESTIRAALAGKGYVVTQDPKNAHYLLQANVLRVGEGSPNGVKDALANGYGGAVEGAIAGALIGSTGGDDGAAIGGLVGGALGLVADALVKDVTYNVVTDIQVSERVSADTWVTETLDTQLAQGQASHIKQTMTEASPWKRYQTRIVSSANRANLKLDEAKPLLVTGLTRSISGLF